MAKTWNGLGNDITVIAGMIHANKQEKRPEYKDKYFKFKTQGSVKVWRCHVSEAYNRNFAGRLWAYFCFMFSSMWAGLFKVKGRYDLIVVTSPPLFVGLSGYIISRLRRIPMVFEVRDLWPESAVETGILKNRVIIRMAYRVEAFIYKKARLINVLTPAFRETLITKNRVPADKIIFVPNAADFSLTEKLLREFDYGRFRREQGLEGKLVFIYVGAHGVSNHLIQVIEAAELLRDRPVLFLLIGDGMQKKMLQEEAAARGLNNVRFEESVPKEEVFRFILASDVGMSVLKKTNNFKTVYSNKTFDYMSCKRPILMAIDGISRQLVADAGAGFYVEPENSHDYVKVVDHYLHHPEVMKKQGESGYRYAKDNFDRTALAERYLAHIQKVAKHRVAEQKMKVEPYLKS